MGPAALGPALSPPAQADAADANAAPPAQEAFPAAGVDSGTDADALSSFGEDAAAGDSELRDVPVEQRGARLFWARERAKARWRSFNDRKPARRVRRVIERKGNGKGKGYRAFIASLSEDDLRGAVAGFGKGRGKGKGEFRNGGAGSGR